MSRLRLPVERRKDAGLLPIKYPICALVTTATKSEVPDPLLVKTVSKRRDDAQRLPSEPELGLDATIAGRIMP
jgi:hypothetical protein